MGVVEVGGVAVPCGLESGVSGEAEKKRQEKLVDSPRKATFEQRSSGMGFCGEHMQKSRVFRPAACLGTSAWWVTAWCIGWDAGTVWGDWGTKDFGTSALVVVSV